MVAKPPAIVHDHDPPRRSSGIDFMANCWDYNDGAREVRMGTALRDGYDRKSFS